MLSNMGHKKYVIIIFDMDGTILDSRGKGEIEYEWAYEAFQKTLSTYKINFTVEEIDKFFYYPLYSNGEEGVRSFCNKFGLDVEEFWDRRERDVIESKIEAMRRGEINPFEDAEEVIKYLSENFYLAIVSDSQQECVDYALEHFKLKRYFKIWYGRRSEFKNLRNRKPNPFYINKVLDELNTRKAILVDDSPLGILAAKRAGIDSMFIYREEGEKIKYEPTFLVNNITELRRIL